MKLEDLRGSRKGHVYLCGNAPKLADDIRGKRGVFFGMNRVGKLFDPELYICIDRYLLDTYPEEVLASIVGAKTAFVPHDTTDRFDATPIIVKNKEMSDIAEGVYCYGTTMTAAIQLIDFMGFDDITVLGVDFYGGDQLHFYSDDSMYALPQAELERRRRKNLRAHAWIIKYCAERGIGLEYAQE